MFHSRRRLPAFAASAALVAGLLPLSALPASAAQATARSIDDGCPEQRVPDAGLNDTAGKAFELEINCIAWYGVTSGDRNGNYNAGSSVTRGQMAKFLVNLIEATGTLLDPSPPDAFADDNGTAFELQINQLANLNVVGGAGRDTNDADGDGSTDDFIYAPNALVSRAQMAKFINNTHAAITSAAMSSADDFFTDDNGTAFESDINGIAAFGIATGTGPSTYNVGGQVSRGAMAAFLAREIDYLVDLGFLNPPISGTFDVLLNSYEINQGRQVIGRIVTQDDAPVTSAVVDICNGANGTGVSMNEDNFAFSFTIPFETTPGSCNLVFRVGVGNSAVGSETQTITVIETVKALLGPELVSIAIQTVGSDTVTISYEFAATTPLNDAVEASKFRLYGFAGQQFSALSAVRVGDARVEAIFTRDQYDDATTGGIAQFAVQDQNGFQVAEYAFGIKDVRLNEGETSFPDLLSVTTSQNNATFTFDAPVFGAAPGDFAAIYVSNGVTSTVPGAAIQSGSEGGSTFTVTFTPPESGGVILRGVIQANSIASVAEGDSANARQAEDVDGVSQASAPYLKSLILDQTNNQVQFVFSEAVTSGAVAETTCPVPLGCTEDPGIGVEIYDINGTTFRTTDVVEQSQNTLVATFDQGIVTGLIQGGSVDSGLAIAQRNNTLVNGIDEEGRQNTFIQGRTAAPDLLKITRLSDADGNLRITYSFDQTVELTDAAPIGDFIVYAQDNTRTIITDDCEASGVEVICTLAAGGDTIAAGQTATYASVSYGAVNAGNNEKRNPEGGFLF